MTRFDEAAFWSKVHRHRPDACWTWLSNHDGKGYGRFKGQAAHRVAYELLVGPIPYGLHIDHLCRNPACVNPTHMEPVTLAENTRRGLNVSARNAIKTHCQYGHPFDETNTYWRPTGGRRCKRCASRASNDYNKQNRARNALGNA